MTLPMTPPMTLPDAFLSRPIAHRAYHDKAQGRPENSRAAIRAAIEAGYGIEIDLQPSSDGVPMVFHDHDLHRLTGETGPTASRTAAQLAQVRLRHSDEGIPTLAEVLEIVAGRVALLIEIKDQDGAMGGNLGPLGPATAKLLAGYRGPVAVMSFNPHAVAEMARLAPQVPRGITTAAFGIKDWHTLPTATRRNLRAIPDYDRVGASFISHEATDLGRPRVADLRAKGAAVLCWTIRSPAAEAMAREIAHNITFEGYAA